MSPAIKSKTKDKSMVKATEQQKAATKLLAAPANGARSAYNPVSGTFYALETAPPSFESSILHQSPDDQSGSSNGTPEYDSMSNNGSCSGESEDQKDRGAATAELEPVPGADADKREKTRQKNERKHQRQKERRARELHERCSRCLRSRKLLALSQQLVAMGFPADRATAALLVNGGRLEESVAWLFEGGEEEAQPAKIDAEINLKIDIVGELAKIAEMEIRFKCSKQDVERAVISCEGDIEKAAATLRDQKQDPPSKTMSHPSGDLSTPPASLAAVARTPQAKPVGSAQPKRDDRDFNYTKAAAAAVTGTSSPDSGGNRSSQPARRPQPRGEWTRLQEAAAADKWWPNASSGSSISHAMTAPLQVASPPAAKAAAAARYAAIGAEARTSLHSMGTPREPAVVIQRPQSNARQTTSTVGLNVPPPATSGWPSPGEVMTMMTTMKPPIGVLGTNMQGMNPISALHYHRNNYQPLVSSSVVDAPPAAGPGGRWNPGPSLGAASPSSSSLAVPSSLGLFTGWGSSGSSGPSSPVDWTSTGSLMMQCDYASIDWSLDSTAAPLRPKLGPSLRSDRLYGAWASAFAGDGLGRRPGVKGGGVCIPGLPDGGVAVDSSSQAGHREWTSPFAGKDLFSLSRQFVTSPSL